MDIFDIIGPVMIGPSSSHTAGAVRMGGVARGILGEKIAKAEIFLAGSFAETYRGHGTDKAIVAGLLGMQSDDERIRDSFRYAGEADLEFVFSTLRLPRVHPNTARLHLRGESGRECTVQGASVGGGSILITSVNGMETAFSGNADTLIIPHQDTPGVIASVSSLMAEFGVNIGNFRLNRPHKGFQAIMTLEIDGGVPEDALLILKKLPHVNSVVYLPAIHSGDAPC
ncbi:MAG: L-serine ammonia-lyase, iron-sulfur-dependent subunit beta [Desulfovibrio sp.]|jgi:L-serine dehydratase|nr:L-serine ammonia-lyase, iron-sulfur-dependent subunit beta [Desulfovibrio sp.]